MDMRNFSSCLTVPDSESLHQSGRKSIPVFYCAVQHCRFALPEPCRGLDATRPSGIIWDWAVVGRGRPARKPAVAMTQEEERDLREQLARLQEEHRDLDAAILALQDAPGSDLLQIH